MSNDTEDKVVENVTGYPSIDKPWLKYYSEEAINTPLPECTMYDYLWENNKDYLNRVALSYLGKDILFEELFENIERVAKAFTAIGVKKGDIIIMASVTTPETVYAFYALNRLGAVPNMVDPRTSVEGIREYVQEVQAKYVLTLDVCYEKVEEAIKGTLVKKVIVTTPVDSLVGVKKYTFKFIGAIKGNKSKLSNMCIMWDTFVREGGDVQAAIVPYEKNACCVIVHTGGTTGKPKGVMLSNENINALVVQSILTGIDMKKEHTWLDIMPPFIAYGIGMGLHLPLVIGMKTILIPQFDAKKFDELILKYKPVHMVGVPSYWGTIVNSKKMKKESLSFIIAPTVGGDTMDTELEKAANAFLKEHGCAYGITKGYGMTEVSAGVTGTVDANNEIGSVGIPFVKTVISIFNPVSGEELSYNQVGEICISGPNVMLGYFDNPDATNEIIRVHKDGRKWVHSGDIGYMNKNGSIFVVDRIKRMIIRYDGFKVFPSSIENVVLKHDFVENCCVVGMEDKQHMQGKLPVVFVVCNQRFDNDRERLIFEIKTLCGEQLPEYAQPVDIHLVEKLPLTSIGKIDYRALEEM